ncbi:twin-arginine translocation signal domain-containing protein [Streptomyces filamentosus]
MNRRQLLRTTAVFGVAAPPGRQAGPAEVLEYEARGTVWSA